MRARQEELDRLLDEAAALVRRCRLAFALTGAGVSVASGIPDFRSPGGLWARHDPMEAATAEALVRRPDKVRALLAEIVGLVGRVRPNPAHLALARLEAAGLLAAVVTQNIDNLHQAAGSVNVIEFHGGLGAWRCMACGLESRPALDAAPTPDERPWDCAACGGLARPDIVFFGEPIPLDALEKSGQLALSADLVLVAGTSGEVAPACRLPFEVKARGGTVIEINLGPSAYREMADVRLTAPVEAVLPRLAERLGA